VYFSVITATGTGYGDIVPLGLSRVFAAIESFSGLLLLAVFVSKLLSRRQDITLKEVHETSFQNAFRNMREDLYIVRKDIDLVISDAQTRGSLTESEWDRLAVAFQLIGQLIEEIPNFYDTRDVLYTIDVRREKLLIEAVQRTMLRVEKLITTLKRANVGLPDTQAAMELELTLETLERILPLWEAHAHHKHEVHTKLYESTTRIRAIDY